MNKKQGSAMVLAILLLSFFMALSLNMWYISQKKAQRAGDIVIGNRVLTDIDSSSTLGYYEFYLATEYMVNGFVTSPSAYTLPTSTTTYAISTSPVAFSTTIEGISLENERQYFGSYISTTGALSTTANAILEKEEIVGSKLKSRTWNRTVSGAKITELWENSTGESIGGYKIRSLKVKPVASSTYTTLNISDATAFATAINTIGSYNIQTVYEKTIFLESNNTTKNSNINYVVEVNRESTIDKVSAVSGYNIIEDSIGNITVTLQ